MCSVLGGVARACGMAGADTFTEQVVIPSAGAIKVGNDVPFDVASLLGCGVMTGAGAAINAAKVEPGASVLVIGCGGVGISAIPGARICGAAPIVAVRLVERTLAWATHVGAPPAVPPGAAPAPTHEAAGGARCSPRPCLVPPRGGLARCLSRRFPVRSAGGIP